MLLLLFSIIYYYQTFILMFLLLYFTAQDFTTSWTVSSSLALHLQWKVEVPSLCQMCIHWELWPMHLHRRAALSLGHMVYTWTGLCTTMWVSDNTNLWSVPFSRNVTVQPDPQNSRAVHRFYQHVPEDQTREQRLDRLVQDATRPRSVHYKVSRNGRYPTGGWQNCKEPWS